MAIVTMLAGGMIGFISGLVVLVMGSGFVAAMSLWFTVALGASALAGLFAMLPRRNLVTVDA